MLKLQFRDRRQEAVWLVDQHFTIGSDSANSLMVSNAGLQPKHAEIENRQDKLFVKDIAAQGNVFVNGEAVQNELSIDANDVLTVGNVEFEIIDPKKDVQQYEEKLKALSTENWKLVSNASWLEQKTFEIDKAMTIGRDSNCDICLPLDHLSRNHAQVELRGKRLFVKDLNSSNGTYVNGNRVTEAELKSGDKLKFDVVTFEVESPRVSDPNKTIIRSVEPDSASAPARKKTAAKPAQAKTDQAAKRPSKAKQAPKKKPLVAEGKQDWIKNEPISKEKSGSKVWLLVIAVVCIAAAAGIIALA